MTASWYVYLLKCGRTPSLYCGIALNPWKRLREHVAGRGSKYVRSHLPAEIAFIEICAGKGAALRREAEIKRMTAKTKWALAFSRPHAESHPPCL